MVVGQPFDTVKVSLCSHVYIWLLCPLVRLWRVTSHVLHTYRQGFRQMVWMEKECTEESTTAFHI